MSKPPFNPLARPTVQPTVRLPGQAAAPARSAPQAGPTKAEINQALHQGGALFAAKRFADAERVAKLILQFEPKQADALHLLGLVTLAIGDAAEAERLMLKSAKIFGKPVAVLLVNLGNAARKQGKAEKALKYYAQAEAANPRYEDVFLERGILFNDARRFKDALEQFEILLALNPDSLAAYSGAAHAESELGQFRLAIEFCQRALARFPDQPIELLAMIATAYERLSELDPAIEWCEKVLAREPLHAPCLRAFSKASRRRAKGDKQVLATLRARLEAIDVEALSLHEGRLICSELAYICDELGDHDAAFGYFKKQNDKTFTEAVQLDLDRTTFIGEVDQYLEEFDADALQKIGRSRQAAKESEGAGDQKRAPVFIIGFPRSGTTLLDQILDANPQVQVIEEQPLMRRLANQAVELPGGIVKGLSNLTASQRKRLREVYEKELKQHGADFSKPVIIDKMPLSLVQIPVIAAVFPDAKIILSLRHPADSCLSCFMQDFEMNGAMLNFTSMAKTVALYDKVMTLWQRYEAHLGLDVVEVRYERLITDLRAEVEPVLSFLGLTWDAAQADPAAHARARGTIRTPSYAQVTQPIYSSAADRWRRYEKHLAGDLPVLEKHIRHFGYEL
ncbi:MAG: tetratricopeptide repeat-containing sulfotransferase family protein [Parvibaculaceae bacterium]